jgi:hypothetical protein
MDPLTILGVVSNVFQVVDFSLKLLTSAEQIRAAGSTLEHADFESTSVDLKKLDSRLKTSLKPPGVDLTTQDQDLHILADKNVLVADELIADLDRLKVSANCTRL